MGPEPSAIGPDAAEVPVMRQAIAVMAKDPRAGASKTRLCPPLDARTAAELSRCFLLDVLDLAGGLAEVEVVVAFTPPEARPAFTELAAGRFRLIPQEGSDLGARMENTFRTLFGEGYARVAVVGTDSPDLPPEHLRAAFHHLERSPVVLGPSADGGYYLIGMSRLIPELFREVPWGTDRVLGVTAERASPLGLEIARLPEWHDVDTAADLARLCHELARDDRPAGRAPRTAAFCRQALQRLTTPSPSPSFARTPWQQIASRPIYANQWMAVREDQVRLPDGRETIYGVVDCGNCVGVLPFVDRSHVLLVGQYRYVVQRFTWEMPTGCVRPGETFEAAVQRELAEEAGYRAERLTWVSTFHTSKSVMDETAHLYLGEGLVPASGAADDTEFIERRVFPFREVLDMVTRAEITDAMTVIAVLHAAQRLRP